MSISKDHLQSERSCTNRDRIDLVAPLPSKFLHGIRELRIASRDECIARWGLCFESKLESGKQTVITL